MVLPKIPPNIAYRVPFMTVARLRHFVLLLAFALPATADDVAVDFDNDLQPIFTRFGCTSGPCHGKARGQGGFQLSLLGFDADYDFDAITKEGRGRRVFAAAPERSMILAKPSGLIPHGGGKRFEPDGDEYNTLLRWIRNGMPRAIEDAPRLLKVTVSPEAAVAHNGAKICLLYTSPSPRDRG